MTEATYAAPLGAVDVKLTKSTQGVSLEVDCKRPREMGETWEEAAAESARIAVEAYRRALREMGSLGLVPGKEAKA